MQDLGGNKKPLKTKSRFQGFCVFLSKPR